MTSEFSTLHIPKHVFIFFIYYLYIYLKLQHWLMVSLEKFMSHQCVCVILVQFYSLIGFLYNSSNNNNNIHLQHQANHNNYKHLFNQFNNIKLIVGGNQQQQQRQWLPQTSTHLHATFVLLFVNVTINNNQTKVLFVIIIIFDYGSWPCM